MVKKPKFRRKFDKEFKIQAVKMVIDDEIPVIEVAKKLEVNQMQIHKWKQDTLAMVKLLEGLYRYAPDIQQPAQMNLF